MEQNIFITEIKINQLRHLHDITIPIGKYGGQMKHLILTGKNGSGKTSLLGEIANNLNYICYNSFDKVANLTLKPYSNIRLTLTKNYFDTQNAFRSAIFVVSFFEAKRSFSLERADNIEKISLPSQSSIKENNSSVFLKYLVFQRSKLTDAFYRYDFSEVNKIEKWFSDFENTLKVIFGDPDLALTYDSTNLNYNIIQTNKNVFDFNTLSDGYASVLNIVLELMMRMENKKADAYDINGIVLIDEIETHLHIELQKSILPFLTAFFPKVQFIVTTHSPFILNSIENAVVYDLENNILFEDASELSYSGLVKNYFMVDSEYSHLMEKKITSFEGLINNISRTEADDEKLADLLVDLKTLSPLLSPEMYIRFQQAQKKILKHSQARL